MKTTLKIAQTELALLFYSPIAWFLMVAFMFQCGLAYVSVLENSLISQELGGRALKYLSSLTARTFAPPFGILQGLVGKLYLYLPLLTMGLMSREINAGTIRLLYSSPIKIIEIIMGKFLAMMVYNALLVMILAVIVVLGLIHIQSADAGLLFSGLFGIYLLLCAYAAIGLFMSSLTSYQVVAALSTLVLLAVLNYVGTLWQGIDFVRDLTYFLSISGRTEQMLRGLITTKDVLYFVVIIFIFLSFSVCKLQSEREVKPFMIRASRYVLILAGALVLGYISSRPGFIGYLDTTAGETMTLTVNAQKIVREMGDAPLEVTSYINLFDNHQWYGRPENRNEDMDRWEGFLRFKPNIKFRYVYFYDSVEDKSLYKYNPGMTLKALAEKYTKSYKLDLGSYKTPSEIRQMIDLRPEQNRYVMQLKYNGKSTFLRLFDDQIVFPTETETGAALKRLMQAKLPRIVFAQGDLERVIDKNGDRHYKVLTNYISFRYSLINQGFDVSAISLKDQEIPKDIAALVIADPKMALDTASLARLQRYINDGGNLLIAGEPGKQAILNPVLQQLGVHMMDGMMVQQSRDFSPDLLQTLLTPGAESLTKKLQASREDSICVSMPGAAALSYANSGPFKITPILMTARQLTWNKKVRPDEEAIESDGESGSPVDGQRSLTPSDAGQAKNAITYSAQAGDQKGPLPVALALTRMINRREQRIAIFGDADFLSNSELSRNNIQNSNFVLGTGLFSWFSYGEFPIDTSRPKSTDNRFNLLSAQLPLLRIFLLGILPGLMLVMGSVLLIRRKRK